MANWWYLLFYCSAIEWWLYRWRSRSVCTLSAFHFFQYRNLLCVNALVFWLMCLCLLSDVDRFIFSLSSIFMLVTVYGNKAFKNFALLYLINFVVWCAILMHLLDVPPDALVWYASRSINFVIFCCSYYAPVDVILYNFFHTFFLILFLLEVMIKCAVLALIVLLCFVLSWL